MYYDVFIYDNKSSTNHIVVFQAFHHPYLSSCWHVALPTATCDVGRIPQTDHVKEAAGERHPSPPRWHCGELSELKPFHQSNRLDGSNSEMENPMFFSHQIPSGKPTKSY
jgi:hypothetical protein